MFAILHSSSTDLGDFAVKKKLDVLIGAAPSWSFKLITNLRADHDFYAK